MRWLALAVGLLLAAGAALALLTWTPSREPPGEAPVEAPHDEPHGEIDEASRERLLEVLREEDE